VLYCVRQLYTVNVSDTHAHSEQFLKLTVDLVFFLDFCMFLCVPVSFAFLVLGLVCSVVSQEIGRGECLRNDLFCVDWDVKP